MIATLSFESSERPAPAERSTLEHMYRRHGVNMQYNKIQEALDSRQILLKYIMSF